MRYLLLMAAGLQAGHAEPARAPPIDGCGNDPAFVEYRARLKTAAADRDVAALRALTATDILISFGNDKGWAKFAAEWELYRPRESPLWDELAELIELGCEDLGDLRLMPGNFSRLGEFDGPELIYFAVIKNAAFRSRPDETAPIMMRLDNHVLFAIETVGEDWFHGRLSDGRAGYVLLSAVRSATAHRAAFEKREGRWVMTSLVAGD